MAYKQLTYEKTETVDIAEKDGQVTEGTLLGTRDVNFGLKEDGKTPDIRVIVDMQGPLGPEDKFSFWAPTAVKINLPQIPVGSKVRLTYRGMEKNPKTGRKFKGFDVEVDDGSEIPV
jgi:hypothetical protein